MFSEDHTGPHSRVHEIGPSFHDDLVPENFLINKFNYKQNCKSVLF